MEKIVKRLEELGYCKVSKTNYNNNYSYVIEYNNFTIKMSTYDQYVHVFSNKLNLNCCMHFCDITTINIINDRLIFTDIDITNLYI